MNTLTKLETAQLLLSGRFEPSLFIHLDPRAEGVVVPPWLRHQAQLVLQVGFYMTIPIDDLIMDSFGVSGTLSFARTPYKCTIPWTTVFALVGDTGTGIVFNESMPQEVKDEVAATEAKAKLPWPPATKRQKFPAIEGLPLKADVSRSAEPRKRALPKGWKVIPGGNGGGDYGNAS